MAERGSEAVQLDPLGDGLSVVSYIGHYGDDLFVINRGRVSVGRQSTKVSPWGERFIQRMARLGHWTPFGHPQITLRFKMPIFIVREWRTHTVGLIRSEESRRDVTTTPDVWIPKPTEFRHAPTEAERMEHKRSGITTFETERGNHLAEQITRNAWSDKRLYERLVEDGVAPEQARTVLPQSMYVNFDETGSLAAYARVYGLRAKPDAMYEIQLYADALDKIIGPLFPISWKALTDGR